MRIKNPSFILLLALGAMQGQPVCSNACDSTTKSTHSFLGATATLTLNQWVELCTITPVPALGASCSELLEESQFEACIAQFCPFLAAEISADSPSCGYCLTTPVPGESETTRVFKCAGKDYNPVDAFQCRPSDAFQVRYAVNLDRGDSVINLSNVGALGPFVGLAADPSGNICANVYAFSPQEEQLACCSCLVTPNGLASLSVKDDLLSNTLSPETANSVVIELTASLPSATGSCNAAAPNFLAPGLVAWGTTLHAVSTSLQTTETEFLQATPSLPELTNITSFCGFIQANGSGYGICKSCRAGGLGGAKK